MDKNITLSGDITYNGKERADLLEELPWYVTNQVDDHYPRLTVQEMFEFAHRCCTGKELAPVAVEAIKNGSPEHHEHALDILTAHHKFAPELNVKMLGLEKCKDTIVGNAMLRGVSGRERKHVTTGEMLFGMKRLQLLDEISTGLDSAATFDICKAMKSASRSFNATVVISLLQPSPEVFELFDDVLLLNESNIMFQRNRQNTVPYFERMGFHCPPRKDVADFLLDLGTNKFAYIAGRSVGGNVSYLATEFTSHLSIFQFTLMERDAPFTGKSMLDDFQPFRQTFAEDLSTLLRRQVMLRVLDRSYEQL